MECHWTFCWHCRTGCISSRYTTRLSLSLSALNGHFYRWTWVSRFFGAKDDGSGGDNWSYKTFKAPVKMSPSTNQHPAFYRPDALLSPAVQMQEEYCCHVHIVCEMCDRHHGAVCSQLYYSPHSHSAGTCLCLMSWIPNCALFIS